MHEKSMPLEIQVVRTLEYQILMNLLTPFNESLSITFYLLLKLAAEMREASMV